MRLRSRRLYWVKCGGVAFITRAYHFHNLCLGYHTMPGSAQNRMTFCVWNSAGVYDMIYEGGPDVDLVCEPASRERIVFPHPSTCPRWYDALKREQKEAEEVLFDASLL